jgi:O-antigen ligase
MEEYTGILLRPVQRILVFLYDRIVRTWGMIREAKLSRDPSMRVRLKETAAAFDQVVKGSLPTKIFGHGLGARLEFEEWGFNTLSEEIVFKNPNYLHNFFAFLALKLGLLGGLSILAALGAWMYQSIQMIFHRTRLGGVGPGAASLAVWIAYIAWSVFCPQLIDFGDAAFFGFFLACWMATDHGSPPGSSSD